MGGHTEVVDVVRKFVPYVEEREREKEREREREGDVLQYFECDDTV